MTNEEIRIAVAEEMGWKDCHLCTSCMCGEIVGTTPAPDNDVIATTPNYPASLDACAEFEKTLSDAEYLVFIHNLRAIRNNECAHPAICRCISATPLQRCEAFLRLRNKWKG